MRRLGIFILGLVLVTSCSKEEEEPKVVLDEPVVPMTSQDMTGEFEGEWDNVTEPTVGSIVVNNEYIIIDELPADKTVVNRQQVIYNLSGQKVDANYKGIIIKNGKKILKK